MVIPRRSGRKVEAEQQFGAFPLDPLEALGWEAALCEFGSKRMLIYLHLSTDALRNRKPELCPGLTVCICRQVTRLEGWNSQSKQTSIGFIKNATNTNVTILT
ncbi:hypothetical protein Taro_000791 [Colocasia esculenta]|uniref:Uncharacterized protein n=1 Tax=Colocasia esculenta TaxID=4460 RepID=A0A843T851_COLES|nr:hypothetical protein [Colocasia esculenta]